MKWPGQTIWDARVQGVTGLLCARAEYGVELYASATFAALTTEPARVVVNPNRAFGIADAIDRHRRFSINVMSFRERDLVHRLLRMRRREPSKASILGIDLSDGVEGIPYVPSAQRSLFCEVESRYESGDRYIYISRILGINVCEDRAGDRPLLFPELIDGNNRVERWVRSAVRATGALDFAKVVWRRVRPKAIESIRDVTYRVAGATPDELQQIRSQGVTDHSRRLTPPAAPRAIDKPIGVCIVGTSWGFEHCQSVKQVYPQARLYVCGRDEDRTHRVAASAKADGCFIGLERALADKRVDAVCLALPHDQHRSATEAALAAGKHVLVEKPIATTLADADAMIAAAKHSGKALMVAENMHFRAAVHEAVARINAGDLGEPLYMTVHAGGVLRPRQAWKQDKNRMGGGVIMDIGVHYVRALRLILGEPDSVFASRAMQVNTRLGGEDSAQLIFTSRSGWGSHMLLSWASHRGTLPDIVVAGTGGTIAIWPNRSHLELYPVAATLPTRLLSYVRPYWLRAKLTSPRLQRRRIPLRAQHRSAYAAEMHEFLACVAEGRPPASPPEDGRRDLEIVLTCYESLRMGTPLKLARP